MMDKDLHTTFLGNSFLLLQYVGYHILIDCASDFEEQIKEANIGRIDVILLSNGDNGGIADLAKWMKAHSQDKIIAWMTKDIENRLKGNFGDLDHLDIKHFESEQKLDIFGLEVIPFQVNHGIVFRIADVLVYAKDVGYPVDDDKLKWFDGADTVIFDGAIYDLS